MVHPDRVCHWCGRIMQPQKSGMKKLFCNAVCKSSYYHEKREKKLKEKWTTDFDGWLKEQLQRTPLSQDEDNFLYIVHKVDKYNGSALKIKFYEVPYKWLGVKSKDMVLITVLTYPHNKILFEEKVLLPDTNVLFKRVTQRHLQQKKDAILLIKVQVIYRN